MTKAGGRSPNKKTRLRLRAIEKFSRVETWSLDNRDLHVIHEEVERDCSIEIDRPGPGSSLIGNFLQRIIDRVSGKDVGSKEDADSEDVDST
jgi:hypothetical protein